MVLPLQMEIVGGVHAPVESLLVARNPTFHVAVLGRGAQRERLQLLLQYSRVKGGCKVVTRL